jgi:hypothetical protein
MATSPSHKRNSHDRPLRVMDPYRTISFQNTSQYSAGGPSACGLASVNAVRAILSTVAYQQSQEEVMKILELEETAIVCFATKPFSAEPDAL